MKIPARCNKRDCQARRNLSKRPEEYARWPRCHLPGCSGKMYVDEYRLRRGEKDNPPTCHCDGYPYPHRINTKGCIRYEEHKIIIGLRGAVKNTPFIESPEDAPF